MITGYGKYKLPKMSLWELLFLFFELLGSYKTTKAALKRLLTSRVPGMGVEPTLPLRGTGF